MCGPHCKLCNIFFHMPGLCIKIGHKRRCLLICLHLLACTADTFSQQKYQ